MTTRPAAVRQSELLNQLVIDRNTLEELGRVEVLWMYPQQHQVLGLVCKSGFLGAKKSAFQLAQIDAIGASGILTSAVPEATDAGKVKQLESLLEHEIWSDIGDKIGKITDYVFNAQTGAIAQYLFVSNGWNGIVGEIYQLPPSQILSLGRKRVLVTEAVTRTLKVYQEGLQQKLTKRAETVTEQAKEQLQTLGEHTKARTRSLSQQAKDRVQSLNEQLKENTQTLAERAKERSQILAEQVRERTQILSEQVEEGIQTLTVHAREILDSADEELPLADSSGSDVSASSNGSASSSIEAAPLERLEEPEAVQDEDVWIGADSPAASEIDDDEPWI